MMDAKGYCNEIREALLYYIGEDVSMRASTALSDIDRLEALVTELTKDRDYWQALAMQFHDAVHAEIERRAKVEI